MKRESVLRVRAWVFSGVQGSGFRGEGFLGCWVWGSGFRVSIVLVMMSSMLYCLEVSRVFLWDVGFRVKFGIV